jgi:hypothetical protein
MGVAMRTWKTINGSTDRRRSSGFSLVEFLFAMVILVVGLVGLLGLFSHSLFSMKFAEHSLIAKQKAREALETIFTARNTQQVTFDQLKNVANGGVFLSGFQPMREPGTDGIVGTADDQGVENMVWPGLDGILGNSDDEVRPLSEFERQISVTSINPDLHQITITVRYRSTSGMQRNYQVTSYISRFR